MDSELVGRGQHRQTKSRQERDFRQPTEKADQRRTEHVRLREQGVSHLHGQQSERNLLAVPSWRSLLRLRQSEPQEQELMLLLQRSNIPYL